MKLDYRQKLQVAVAAECDPKTVERYADGQRVQTLSRQRIERTLRRMGLERFIVENAAGAA